MRVLSFLVLSFWAKSDEDGYEFDEEIDLIILSNLTVEYDWYFSSNFTDESIIRETRGPENDCCHRYQFNEAGFQAENIRIKDRPRTRPG